MGLVFTCMEWRCLLMTFLASRADACMCYLLMRRDVPGASLVQAALPCCTIAALHCCSA
jgi:hypothetical protein